MSITIDFPNKIYTVPFETAMKIPLIKELYEIEEETVIHLTVGEDFFNYVLCFVGDENFLDEKIKNDDDFINNLYTILIYYQIDTTAFTKQVKQILLKRHQGRFTKLISSKISHCSDNICINPNISEDFFEKKINKIRWDKWEKLCENSGISEEFFQKNRLPSTKFVIDWETLSENPNISEKFFEKHLNEIVWNSLSRNPNISEEFFEKYGNLSDEKECKLNWTQFCKHHPISESFFEKYISKLVANDLGDDWSWEVSSLKLHLISNPNLSESFLEKYLHISDLNCWSFICQNSGISEEFFEKHMDEIIDYNVFNIEYLCCNKNLSDSFIEKHLSIFLKYPNSGQVGGLALFKQIMSHRSDDFIEKHVMSLPFSGYEKCYYLSNSAVSIAFLKKYKHLINYEILAENSRIKIDNPFEWLDL